MTVTGFGSSNAIVKVWQTMQLKCFDLLENWKFQYALNFTVVLNCATLATTHFGASREWLEVCVLERARGRRWEARVQPSVKLELMWAHFV